MRQAKCVSTPHSSEGILPRLSVERPPFHDNRRPVRQPFIFPKKKTYPSPPMVGTPMQFPQCAMPLTTPAKRERLCCSVSP
jgi:hypothetical protein